MSKTRTSTSLGSAVFNERESGEGESTLRGRNSRLVQLHVVAVKSHEGNVYNYNEQMFIFITRLVYSYVP